MKGKIISLALIGVLLIGIGCIGPFAEEDPEEEVNGEEDEEMEETEETDEEDTEETDEEDEETDDEDTDETEDEDEETEYENGIRDVYMEGCMEEDEELEDFCECTYNYILDEFGEQEFMEESMEEEYSEEFEEVMNDAAIECIEFYPQE